MDLSIIIISYNTKELTKKCIETVRTSLKQDPDIKAEIIVLDNASSDSSAKMLATLKSQFSNLKLITNSENVGFAKGNNQAVKSAHGKFLLFLNSDTGALHDAVPKLYRLFTHNSYGFDFAGAKLLYSDGSQQASIGRFYTLPVACAALFLRGDHWNISRSSPNSVVKTDWVSGACFITSKETFTALGGFDESIFMYWDEMDLFYRAHKRRLSVGFFPNPRFIHHEGASSSSRTQPILKVYEGYLYFYKKHFSRIDLKILKFMLQLKAILAVLIGRLTRNEYLITTYKQAYDIAQKT